MPGPICRCPAGHVFESRMMRFENSTNITFSANTEPCVYPGCALRATTIDATYDFLPDTVRIAIGQTATAEEREAIQGFIAALSARDSPPTAQEVDRQFPDIDPRLREWIKTLVLTVDWPRVKRLLVELLPYLFALYLSYGTDTKVETVGDQVEAVGVQVETLDAQVEELNQKIEQLQAEWRRSLPSATTSTTALSPTPRPTPTVAQDLSGRANPKGTAPQPSKKKRSGGNRKRR